MPPLGGLDRPVLRTTTPAGTVGAVRASRAVRAPGTLGCRRRHDEVAEHRRRLLGVLHGRHDEATRRARGRDDEGPQLVREHLGARLRTDPVRVLGAAGEELD
ncbi:hypothetical protein IU11_07055, partial [Cellulosimicrobium sp. MM]